MNNYPNYASQATAYEVAAYIDGYTRGQIDNQLIAYLKKAAQLLRQTKPDPKQRNSPYTEYIIQHTIDRLQNIPSNNPNIEDTIALAIETIHYLAENN